MTAFLLWWLHELSCLVLNPPVPPSLTSPCWPPERLFLTARGLGIPSLSSRRRPESPLDPATALPAEVVTVVGACCVGTPDPSPERVGSARALASRGGCRVVGGELRRKGPTPSRRSVRRSHGRHGDTRPPGADRLEHVILLWGLSEDQPLSTVADALDRVGADVVFVDQTRCICDRSMDRGRGIVQWPTRLPWPRGEPWRGYGCISPPIRVHASCAPSTSRRTPTGTVASRAVRPTSLDLGRSDSRDGSQPAYSDGGMHFEAVPISNAAFEWVQGP